MLSFDNYFYGVDFIRHGKFVKCSHSNLLPSAPSAFLANSGLWQRRAQPVSTFKTGYRPLMILLVLHAHANLESCIIGQAKIKGGRNGRIKEPFPTDKNRRYGAEK